MHLLHRAAVLLVLILLVLVRREALLVRVLVFDPLVHHSEVFFVRLVHGGGPCTVRSYLIDDAVSGKVVFLFFQNRRQAGVFLITDGGCSRPTVHGRGLLWRKEAPSGDAASVVVQLVVTRHERHLAVLAGHSALVAHLNTGHT